MNADSRGITFYLLPPCVIGKSDPFLLDLNKLGASRTSGVPLMCDYSLHHVKSRPAKVGDKLTTRNFNTGTGGFAAPEDATIAVCILPGTELAFSREVKHASHNFFRWRAETINFKTAIFGKSTIDRKSTRLNSSHRSLSRMPSSA